MWDAAAESQILEGFSVDLERLFDGLFSKGASA
jgi:hypothetical protein